jgi:hypothetical protein
MRSEKLRLSDGFINNKYSNHEQLRLHPTSIPNESTSLGRNLINSGGSERINQISFGNNDRPMSMNPTSRRY